MSTVAHVPGNYGKDTPALMPTADAENSVSLISVDRFERRGVELLVKVSLPMVSEAVKPSTPVLNETILGQLSAAISSVVGDGDVKILEGHRREIPFIAQVLQDLIINWFHPVRPSACHYPGLNCVTHSGIGV